MKKIKIQRRVFLFTLTLIALYSFTWAEEAMPNDPNKSLRESKQADLGKVKVVVQNPEVERIMSTPSFVDVVDTSTAYQRVSSVAEVLSQRVGVQIKRYGGLGSYSTISIRGSNPNQVVIYLDGIPLNDAKFGEVNIENLPIDNLMRMEIFRGTTPGRFGISGIGGVVNLVTKRTTDYSQTDFSLSYGSYKTLKLSLSRTSKQGKLDYLVFFNRTSSDGDFKFLDDNGTPIMNTEDDKWTGRENNDHKSYTGTAKAGYTMGLFKLSLMDNLFYKDQGMPGMYNNSAKHIRFNTLKNICNLTLDGEGLLDKTLFSKLNFYYAMRQDHFDNIRGEDMGMGGAMETLSHFDSFGFDFNNEIIFPKWFQSMNLLLSFQRELYMAEEKNTYTNYKVEKTPTQYRDRYAMVLEDNINIFHDRLQLMPQYRLELWEQQFQEKNVYFGSTDIKLGNKNRSTHQGFQVGTRFFPWSREFYLKVNLCNGFRAPTFTELFGEKGYIIGNSQLKPEDSLSRDFGLGYKLIEINPIINFFTFEYAYFQNEVKNLIVFIHNSQWTIKAQNISKADIRGHEFSFAAQMLNHIKLSGNYTFQKALDRSPIPFYNGNFLPYRPVNEASASLKFFNRRLSLTYEINHIGSNFRDKANSSFYYVKRRTIHGVSIDFLVFEKGANLKNCRMNFEIKNISNNQIRDVAGYPLPGRSFYCTLSGSI